MGLLWAEPGSSAIGPLRGLNQLYIFKISGWRSTYTCQQDFNSHSIFTSFKILRHQLIDEYAKGAHFCSKLLLQGRHDHRKTKPHPHVDGRLDACVFMEKDEKMSKNWVNQRILQLAISVEVLCDLRSIGFSTRP
jgi:hypothetical protein